MEGGNKEFDYKQSVIEMVVRWMRHASLLGSKFGSPRSYTLREIPVGLIGIEHDDSTKSTE